MKGLVTKSTQLSRFGFGGGHGGPHLARTMMLAELAQLFDYVKDPVLCCYDYRRAIEEDNCLGKRSGQTRKLTAKYLTKLYSLEPSVIAFRALRYFWGRDQEGRPLLACICAYARDPILRTSAPVIQSTKEGGLFSPQRMEEYLENKHLGRFSKATLRSTSRNIASTWTQSGHLQGHRTKTRSQANATSGSVAYALLAGYLSGARGLALFETEYAKLLDCSFDRIIELAEVASQRGWITLKRIGNVVEVLFPNLLDQQDMEWIREQS